MQCNTSLQLVKNSVFDKLTEVNKAAKTSNSNPKCMWILEVFELRCKSKSLAMQDFLQNLIRQKSKIFATFPKGEGILRAIWFYLLFDDWRLF